MQLELDELCAKGEGASIGIKRKSVSSIELQVLGRRASSSVRRRSPSFKHRAPTVQATEIGAHKTSSLTMLPPAVLLTVLLVAGSTGPTSGSLDTREPLYSNDDLPADSHTVSAAARGQAQRQQLASRNLFDQPQQRPLTLYDDYDASLLNRPLSIKSIGETIKRQTPISISTAPAQVAPTFRPQTSKKPAGNHWSSLENYLSEFQRQEQFRKELLQQHLRPAESPHNLPIRIFPAPVVQELDNHLQDNYRPVARYQPKHSVVLTSNDNLSTQQVVEIYPISSQRGVGSGSILIPSNNNNNNNNNANNFQDEQVTVDEDFFARYFGRDPAVERKWQSMPAKLLHDRQQQRIKHQQENYPSQLKLQHNKEDLMEEIYCASLRSEINLRRNASAKILKLDSKRLARIQQLDSVSLMELGVEVGASEYPPHSGVYNGSKPSVDSFLCGATWVHERYALTVASCLRGVEPEKLSVRLGEWNLNVQSSQRPMLVRQVKRVHVFPRYRNDSLDHNLALLELAQPVDYLDISYISPACQMQTRSSLQTKFCWAPVHNTSISEYFDPEGEGETRERKSANMIELPVRLIANNDAECLLQTRVQSFNFDNPNYICSADYKTADWRARLNQTDYFGSGVYCNEDGRLNLVSIIHPIHPNSSTAYGYLDLSYYKPWMRNVISGITY